MKKILTVVIPAYNIEKYVEQCLESFVQKEILEDMEVLVINDGSTDRTVALAEKYTEQYPDTFRIIHKENGGHGSTINRGIQEAKGSYLKVVDGDDWVDGEAFVRLVRFLKSSSSDFVVNRYQWVHHRTGEKRLEFQKPFEEVEYGRTYRFDEISDKVFLKMHSLTIRTEILRKIPLIDEHCFYVDMEYVLFPIPFIQTVTFLPDIVYQYRIGLPSQSMNMEKMQKNERNYMRVLDRLLAFYEEQKRVGLHENYLLYLEHCLGRMAATRFKIFLSFSYDPAIRHKMKQFDRELKMSYPKIYHAVINKPVKILRLTDYYFYPLAQLLFQWKERMNK